MSRKSNLTMPAERIEDLGKPGNLNDLVEEIINANEGKIEYKEVVKKLPSWIDGFLTEKQKIVIRLHYFQQQPISTIRFLIGSSGNAEVERSLNAGKKKLVKISKDFV